MKTSFRLILRKTRLHIPQLIGLMLLLIVGVCFFVTLFTIVTRYEESAEHYFIDRAYADITFYGVFSDESIEMLSARNEISKAQGRVVRDLREGEQIFRVISLTDEINLPYIYEGRLPQSETECILLNRNAVAMNLKIGDTLTLGERVLSITGLAASPEYIYMVQNERTLMAHPDRFAVIFVTPDFFPEGFNEIVALTDSTNSTVDFDIGAFRTILQKDQSNYYLYRSDLGEISSFAYIFPLIFAVLIAVVIYVMLKRTIQKDRRQIGTMKAVGVSDGKIIFIYLAQFCVAAFFGAILGCLAATVISDLIIGIFSSMFEVPTLNFVIYPWLWLLAVVISVLICAVSGLVALFAILPMLPAIAMRPRIPKGGKKILIENAGFLWKRFSFNTRYAIKNSMRNKGRFFAVVLGMCGSCALLVFSLGFYDSIGNTQNMYFENFSNYDIVVDFDPIPLAAAHPSAEFMNESQKVLVLPVEIDDANYMFAITESDFDMV
ncbi:MAG: FtsX-like permease family protein, partial [Clostridiales bacterium]|nr:FtsX-like permease family protein [Clostridiales bacterium]